MTIHKLFGVLKIINYSGNAEVRVIIYETKKKKLGAMFIAVTVSITNVYSQLRIITESRVKMNNINGRIDNKIGVSRENQQIQTLTP